MPWVQIMDGVGAGDLSTNTLLTLGNTFQKTLYGNMHVQV